MRGYGHHWRKKNGLRAWVLRREPFCRTCWARGLSVKATVVDHIRPMAQGGSYDEPENLQALCKECHDRKTASERCDEQKAAH